MSNPAPSGDRRGDGSHDATDTTDDGSSSLETGAPSLATAVRKTGFWGAIVFPVSNLPLLANGLSTRLEAGLFLGLLGLNLLALYVGHAYRR